MSVKASSRPISPFSEKLIRVMDCLIAGICLLLCAPVFAFFYWRIHREDGGPAIFKQERIGLKGKPFYIYKFRTMHLEAEADGPQLCEINGNDKRLLHIYRFLRDHHLDELPQLWNVFIGDMAFVGPRPERAYYIRMIMENDPRYEQLYRIRPGVTSYATLYNGYTDTMEKMLRRLELDLYYLEHRSIRLNFSILWQTFYRVLSGRIF